jgi:carboxymethylenebutenolidase
VNTKRSWNGRLEESITRNGSTRRWHANALTAYLFRIPFYLEQATYIAPEIKALVSYGGKTFSTLNETASASIPPQLIHIPGPHVPRRKSVSIIPDSQITKSFEGVVKTYRYDDAKEDSGWAFPADEDYHKRSSGIAHTRSLGFLKKALDGPWFDLEAVWEEHTLYEFGERDVEKTMTTMVDQPYVNHIPTMT